MRFGDLIKKVIQKIKKIQGKYSEKLYYYVLSYDCTKVQPFKHLAFLLLKRNKEVIGFYGECHIILYSKFMRSSQNLRKKYLFVFGDDINRMADRLPNEVNARKIWNKCDYFVYNIEFPIKDNVPKLSSIESWLKPQCKRISVTNVVFEGYFPQHTNRVFENDKYFIWGDKNLNKMLKNDLYAEEGMKELFKDDFYPKDIVIKHYEKSLKCLKLIEKNCDVKIADYIEKYGRDRVLFYSTTHPESEIMEELTKRILLKLNENKEKVDIDFKNMAEKYNLHLHGEIVYPSVYKHLGLSGKYNDRLIIPGKHKECVYSFGEYVNAYIEMGEEGRESK